MAATSWEGAPPIFIQTGTELLTDEGRHVAAKAARQGVRVVYEEYEMMPHCFAMILETLPASRMFFGSWAGFISQCTSKPEEIETGGTTVKPKTLEESVVEVEGLSGYSDDEVLGRMRERVKMMSGKQPDSMSKL